MVTLAVAGAGSALGQVTGLYYQETEKNGRIYVFNTPERAKSFATSGDMGTSITLIGRGPNGETIVGENDTAIDLYLFKHNLPGYERQTPPPPQPVVPSTLKVADGELKFGLLLQSWYFADDTAGASNTFRLRRAEIKLSGKITPSWGFEVKLDPVKSQDFASGKDSKLLQDLAVSYIGLKGHEFSLGQKKITFTEEGLRASSELDFAERSQVVRAVSDRRETGLFYRGEFSPVVSALASVTNGTAANVADDSNDTLVTSARLDFKPATTLLLGVSGSSSAGETQDHLGRTRFAAHVRFDDPSLPVALRAEFVKATDEQLGKADLNRDGFYGTILYNFTPQWQIGVRYDVLDKNTNAHGNKIKTLTAGIHYLVKGTNVDVKLDWFQVKEDGRTLGGVLDERFNLAILAAQVAF